MILSFKKQFAEPILNGSKIHTIRHDSKNRWKEGNKIHFATDVRTKNQVQFHESTCVSVQRISIFKVANISTPYSVKSKGVNRQVEIDGNIINCSEIVELSLKDGFKSTDDFFEWFSEDFEGKLIHWTDKKY